MEDTRRKALDAADLEAIVRPKEVERVCGNCKHYVKELGPSLGESGCGNVDVWQMLSEGAAFWPPSDFGCNKFEAKA